MQQAQTISVTNIQQQILSDDLLKQVAFMNKQLGLIRANANTDTRSLNNLTFIFCSLMSTAYSISYYSKEN